MGIINRAWNLATWTVTVYTIYKQLQTLGEMKNELYTTLTPEQQAEWNRIFGTPGVKLTSPLENLKAGV